MRPWKELQAMLAGDVEQVRFEDAEELGFACGHLTRQFSRWYYKQTGKDFLRHRVMTFGSDLTPEILWQRALSKFGEYRAKLWREGALPPWFERLSGLVLMEFSHRREEIRRERAAFMAAFWAGYSLQKRSGQRRRGKSAESEVNVLRECVMTSFAVKFGRNLFVKSVKDGIQTRPAERQRRACESSGKRTGESSFPM